MTKMKTLRKGAKYKDELDALIAGYLASLPKGYIEAEPIAPNDLLEMKDGKITEKGYRDMHEHLCRRYGMTATQIIEDWNDRCPDDPW